MTIMPPQFFQVDALDLAPRLLGKLLRRDDVVLQITEVTMSPIFPLFPGKNVGQENKNK